MTRSVVGLNGIDKIRKVGKLCHTASKVDNNIPYNAFRTDKLKDLVKTNVYANMQQKAKQTADLLKSTFSKEAINKPIQAAKNSDILTKYPQSNSHKNCFHKIICRCREITDCQNTGLDAKEERTIFL